MRAQSFLALGVSGEECEDWSVRWRSVRKDGCEDRSEDGCEVAGHIASAVKKQWQILVPFA